MAADMQRNVIVQSYAATNSESTTGIIAFGSFAGGVVILPAGVTSLTWYVGSTKSETFTAINDKANGGGVTPSSVSASKAYPFPDEVFGAKFVKIVTNTAAATLTLMLKS